MFESTRGKEVILFPALTIEIALYAALGLIACFARLFLLDGAPLNTEEARQAVASWNFVRGAPNGFTGSPLLFTGNALLFALFGATDAAARLLPALFGGALILLPTLLRRELGRAGALAASALLTCSPTLIFFSRQANGAIIATTCALAALAFGWRYLTDGNARDLYFASGAAALALLAAREAWTFVLFAVLVALASRAGLLTSLSTHSQLATRNSQLATRNSQLATRNSQLATRNSQLATRNSQRAALVFIVIFLAIATAFLLHRDGLGAAFDLFGAWLGGLRPGATWFDPLNLLLVYEPLVFCFGVIALIGLGFGVSAIAREQTPLIVFAFLPILAFLLYSFGADKDPARVVALVVPLALLAGWYIGAWWTRLAEQMQDAPDAQEAWLTQELPVLLLAGVLTAFLYLLVAEFITRGDILAATLLAMLRTPSADRAILGSALIAALGVIAFAAVAFVAIATVGWTRAKEVGLAVLLMLLTVWTVRQAAMLNFAGLLPGDVNVGLNVRELPVTRAASLNGRDLVSELENISRWRANDTHSLELVADASLGALVEWNLREFRYARFVERAAAVQDAPALLLPANTRAPRSGWMSQRYRLESVRVAGAPPNLLRWLLFRDVGNVEFVDVVLWAPWVGDR